MLNARRAHYLVCINENCERVMCVVRREREFDLKKKTAQLSAQQRENGMISVTVNGESRVEIAKRLRAFADNLDGTPAGTDGKVAPKKAATTAAEGTGKVAAGKKTAKAPVAEEEEFDLGEGEASDDAPAVTKADLIAACRDNREAAIAVLKKMKVNSVHELKPAQYSKVLAEIGA